MGDQRGDRQTVCRRPLAGLSGKPVGIRVMTAALEMAAVGAAMTAGLFVWPRTGSQDHVDAVVVLSGDHGERLARALRILDEGGSSTLVLDGAPDSLEVVRLCTTPHDFEVICLRPEPDSTRYEARVARQLVADRNWKRVAVVTTTAHVTRAGRCSSAGDWMPQS